MALDDDTERDTIPLVDAVKKSRVFCVATFTKPDAIITGREKVGRRARGPTAVKESARYGLSST